MASGGDVRLKSPKYQLFRKLHTSRTVTNSMYVALVFHFVQPLGSCQMRQGCEENAADDGGEVGIPIPKGCSGIHCVDLAVSTPLQPKAEPKPTAI